MANQDKKSEPEADKADTEKPAHETQTSHQQADARRDQEDVTSASQDAALDKDIEQETVSLQDQVVDLTDRLLRAHAEMHNQRKRAEKEREDTAKYAITKFAKDIVQVGDNFQRAIASFPENDVGDDPALKGLIDGVSMAEREFHNILQRHSIERIEPTGEAFDPHFIKP